MIYKKPVSVLVVIHTAALQVLLLERARHPGFWQSVTGSQEGDEPLIETARREVREETAIDAPVEDFIDWQLTNRYQIFAEWRFRYAPGITDNTEHVFSLCVPRQNAVIVAPAEHLAYRWLPWQEAAELCFSWSNRDAIRELPKRFASAPHGA